MENLPNLLAKKFIARADYKTEQHGNGNWLSSDSSWSRVDIEEHLAKVCTFGHHLVNAEGKSKFVAIRVALEEEGSYLWPDDHTAWNEDNQFTGEVREFNPRAAWFDRAHSSRSYLKTQFKTLAVRLCHAVRTELDIPCVAHYNGDACLDVYGFTGPIPAQEAVEGADIVIKSLEGWGKQWLPGEHNFEMLSLNSTYDKVFLPLPLGKNQERLNEPTFFVDLTGPLDVLSPVDPIWALTTDNPFKKPGE